MRVEAILEPLMSVAQMNAADSAAPAFGVPSMTLMEHAGRAVADAIGRRFTPRPALVLCGPGNNGGDGYVVARILRQRGWPVTCQALAGRGAGGEIRRGDPASIGLKGDAAEAFHRWDGPTTFISGACPDDTLIIDALFGAGLSRPLDGVAADLAEKLADAAHRVIAVDVPSGIHGDTGLALGGLAFRAALTVTFVRRKPGHVLLPGRTHCGDIVCADIGMPASALSAAMQGQTISTLAGAVAYGPDPAAHKYTRGHCLVVSGGAGTTGASRLSALAAARAGAGLTTIAASAEAAAIHAAHLSGIMVRSDRLADLLEDKRRNAVIVGPGLGLDADAAAALDTVFAAGRAAVLDADALTLLARREHAPLPHDAFVLTPHGGEFARLFPDLAEGLATIGKAEATRRAAARIGGTVVFKGPDTVIACPDGRIAIDMLAPPTLATAGTGDVLAGFIGGLMTQGMAPFEAACSGVWLHGATARLAGAGLVADDLPAAVPAVLKTL